MYSEDVSQRKKHGAFFGTVTIHHTVDITAGTEQQQKCYNQVFSGPLFLKMLTSLCVVVIDARELVVAEVHSSITNQGSWDSEAGENVLL